MALISTVSEIRMNIGEWSKYIVNLRKMYGNDYVLTFSVDTPQYGLVADETAPFPATVSTVSTNSPTSGGAAVVVTPGDWYGSSRTGPTYQWYGNGVALVGNGATTNAYTCQAGDIGKILSVVTTYTNRFGSGTSSTACTNVVA